MHSCVPTFVPADSKADGTQLKEKLGGNAITAASFAIAEAGAKLRRAELFEHFADVFAGRALDESSAEAVRGFLVWFAAAALTELELELVFMRVLIRCVVEIGGEKLHRAELFEHFALTTKCCWFSHVAVIKAYEDKRHKCGPTD